MKTGKCLKTFQGHTSRVRSVAFQPPYGQILASSSDDETIKLWDLNTTECLETLTIPRPYKDMNITGVQGLTTAQKATLIALGAVDGE
ncbi:MAG TPA: hypothetical protein V6D15_02830 [Oculatellaceae cyanobacterium]